jgi:hypothetical protein
MQPSPMAETFMPLLPSSRWGKVEFATLMLLTQFQM